MALTIQAAVVEQFGRPLAIHERAVPSPGTGQILVKTEACGMGHTDVHAAKCDGRTKPHLPLSPGLAAVALITRVGPGVTIVKGGGQVGVSWLSSACGHYESFLAASKTLCAEAEFGGYTEDGGCAQCVLADPNYVAQIPPGLQARDAAPLTCAGIPTYAGIKKSAASPMKWIAIHGIGGPEHLAVQAATALGLLVCAIDIAGGKLAHAKKLDADVAMNTKSADPAVALKGANRRGSFVGTQRDMPEAFAFAAGNKVKADIEL